MIAGVEAGNGKWYSRASGGVTMIGSEGVGMSSILSMVAVRIYGRTKD